MSFRKGMRATVSHWLVRFARRYFWRINEQALQCTKLNFEVYYTIENWSGQNHAGQTICYVGYGKHAQTTLALPLLSCESMQYIVASSLIQLNSPDVSNGVHTEDIV